MPADAPQFQGFVYFLALIGPLTWILQLILIVHVYKTGRPYWWIAVLFIAPGIGAIAYLVAEILPDLNRGGGIGWRPRVWRIRDLRRSLDECDVVDTRLLLAEELVAGGHVDEAYSIAEESLQGVFKDDPHTLTAVARFALEAGKPLEAEKCLNLVNPGDDKILQRTVSILRGRVFYENQKYDDAIQALRNLPLGISTEEPRYFLAMALIKSGEVSEGKTLLEDIRKKFRSAGRIWRRKEGAWFRLAKQQLKSMRN